MGASSKLGFVTRDRWSSGGPAEDLANDINFGELFHYLIAALRMSRILYPEPGVRFSRIPGRNRWETIRICGRAAALADGHHFGNLFSKVNIGAEILRWSSLLQRSREARGLSK